MSDLSDLAKFSLVFVVIFIWLYFIYCLCSGNSPSKFMLRLFYSGVEETYA